MLDASIKYKSKEKQRSWGLTFLDAAGHADGKDDNWLMWNGVEERHTLPGQEILTQKQGRRPSENWNSL